MTNHIRTLLSPFLHAKKTDWKVKLLSEWEHVMGPMAQHVTIIKIYDDTVMLGVYDSSWLQELYLLSTMIIDNINRNLDVPRIKQLRFKQIKRSTTSARPLPSAPFERESAPIVLTSVEQRALDRVANEHLRTVLKSFLVRCHRERNR